MYRNSSVLITGGTASYLQVAGDFVQKNGIGFERLERHVAAGALHNSGEVSDQPKCHAGTRVAILEHLEAWGRAATYLYPIIWLHGPAGSGKSAILRSIAQILFDQGLLLGSFFFFRSASGRNSSEHLIATISYQLALSIPSTRPHIEEAIEKNPLIFSLSLWDQAQALILSPIIAVHSGNPSFDFSQFPRVIIIDGLDECRGPDKQCQILDVLGRIFQNLPIPLAILVASRPEPNIRGEFNRSRYLNALSSRLSLDNSYDPDADIQKYLDEMFTAIKRDQCIFSTSPWPSPIVIDKLVAKASGQFIYASTVVKFVSSPRHNPVKRLDIILGMLDAGNLKPFEQLDILYSTIFLNITESDLAGVLRVLGALLVPYEDEFLSTGGRTPAFLERLLNLETGDIRRLLYDLESLLTINNDNVTPVRFFHASLSDYLFDSSRSGQFYIDPGMVYADLAQHCTDYLSESKNSLDIKKFAFKNISLFFSKATPTPGLRYAIESCDLRDVVDFSICEFDPNYDDLQQLDFDDSDSDSIHSIAPPQSAVFKRVSFSDISPTFVQAIRDSPYSDANELYLHKLALYKMIIRPRFQFYFRDIRLKRLLVAGVAIKDLRGHYESLRCIFKIPEKLWAEQRRQGLNLECASSALIGIIKQVLDDDSDPNTEFFVDDNQYAEIASDILTFMTQEPLGPLSRFKAQNSLPFDHDPWQSLYPFQAHSSKILSALLSKVSIRQDLFEHIKNTSVHSSYLTFNSMKNAIVDYITVQSLLSHACSSLTNLIHRFGRQRWELYLENCCTLADSINSDTMGDDDDLSATWICVEAVLDNEGIQPMSQKPWYKQWSPFT